MSLKVGGSSRGRLHFDHESDSRTYHSKFYEGDDNYTMSNLERDLPRFFEEPDIDSIQVIMEVYNPETGHTTTVSKVISEERYYELEYESMEEYLENEIFSMEQYQGYVGVAGGISVRAFYAK